VGPVGYFRKLLLDKWMRDAKINDLFERTGQLNRLPEVRDSSFGGLLPRWNRPRRFCRTAAISPLNTLVVRSPGLQVVIDKVMSAFVIDPNPKAVDASCADKLVMPAFK